MKPIFLFLFVVSVFLWGCDKSDTPVRGEGFKIMIGDKTILKADDIDYYDFSSHLIYLKNNNSFFGEELARDSFAVYADGVKIYSGIFHPGYSSTMPSGAIIYIPVSFYADYVLPINFDKLSSVTGKSKIDHRGDERIRKALADYNQLHEGLSCNIKSIQAAAGGKVNLEIELTNNDSFSYYYLDPSKMGIGLFHYYTNGLALLDMPAQKWFTHQTVAVQPPAWDAWDKAWLSIIKSKETKTILITYDHFDTMPLGKYNANFMYPGLSVVEKKDLLQTDGQIWLGELSVTKEITVK